MYPVIDHLNRYVSDVDKHSSFYRDVLGYELIGRGVKTDGSRYAILSGSGHELYISEKPGSDAKEMARHIGFAVEDADGLLERLRERGIVGDETEIVVKEYSRQFYMKDPDGNEIDIIQWTDKERFYDDLKRKR